MILYSTLNCPKCKILKDLLDKKEINYEICIDIPHMINLGITSVPQLLIGEKLFSFEESMQKFVQGE